MARPWVCPRRRANFHAPKQSLLHLCAYAIYSLYSDCSKAVCFVETLADAAPRRQCRSHSTNGVSDSPNKRSRRLGSEIWSTPRSIHLTPPWFTRVVHGGCGPHCRTALCDTVCTTVDPSRDRSLWRAVAACARAWQRSLAWAPRLALHLFWHHAWVAVARMAHAGMRGCRQALEKSGYAQGLWYVRRRVGCAVFARWTQCLRSMYQQPDGSGEIRVCTGFVVCT